MRAGRVAGPVLALFVAAAAPPLRAAPLDRKQLPADARWFVHLDFDAARTSEIGKALQEVWLAQPGTKDGLERFRAATGSDPLTGFHDLTVFNTGFEPNVGVLVLHAKFDKDRLARTARVLPDHTTTAHGRHELHAWTDPDSGRRTVGAVHDDGTVVIGQTESAVGNELDVLDGKGDTLASGQSEHGPGRPAPGAVVEAAASGLSSAKGLPIESPILRQCDELTLTVGEHDGRAFLHAQLVTRSAEVAGQVRSLVDGLKALIQLQQNASNPDLAGALAPIKVSAEDRAVRVDWEVPAADVARVVREQAARAARPAERKEPKKGE